MNDRLEGSVVDPGDRMARVGVVEHGNTAVLVTLDASGHLLDRRTIALTRNLPTHPYHHEGAWAVGRYLNSPWAKPIRLPEAEVLIEAVHAAALTGAADGLAALAASLATPIGLLAIRQCPPLPPTIRERIMDHQAEVIADSVLYRQAVAQSAKDRGWIVVEYDRDQVFDQAATILPSGELEAYLRRLGQRAGTPWQARHKLAAAAALAGRGAALGCF